MRDVKGFVNSIQSLGTLDGPGIRFVVFLQGCNLRCSCCHNPDTWEKGKGTKYSSEEIVKKALRYKSYFEEKGGITLSGGEPLMQAEFAKSIFALAKKEGINTCLDTSGSIINEEVIRLLDFTDRVLLDIKYHTDELYKKHVGCSLTSVLKFLDMLQQLNIPTVIRQVIIPSINDTKENMDFLRSLRDKYSCIEKTELLPFKKICITKYQDMKIPFKFEHLPCPDKNTMNKLELMLKD